MSVNNGENRNENQNFDEKHRFIKGNNASKGKRKRTQTDKLLTALKKEGKRLNKNFWEEVAKKAFVDKEIMKAIINKLVPNISEITGAGGEPINITLKRIFYSEMGEEDKENIGL